MVHLFSKIFVVTFFIMFSTQLNAADLIVQSPENFKKPLQPKNIRKLMQEAQLLFDNNQHQQASNIYTNIIRLHPDHYPAYFGRGMALGRLGKVQDGINDLTFFIQHNADSSLAYTKRGVRYLWLGDLQRASEDLKQAILLNPKNAEAHDDLGVILARQNKPEEAISHFLKTIKHDPSYQKAYHNLALTYYLYDKEKAALKYVNKAISMSPDSKDTILLKSEILKSLGQVKQAEELREHAEFLPDGNWSESSPLQ